MADKTLTFRIFLDDQLVDTRTFEHDVIKLGRLASSHLRLDDEAVARMHAVIEVGPSGDVRLIDLGSGGGTRINGGRVAGNRALRAGDSIEVGPYTLELAIVETSVQPTPASAAAPGAPSPHTPVNAPSVNPSVAPSVSPSVSVDLSTIEDSTREVVEVVTSFGASILDVSHVGQARSRKRSAAPLMALGGLFMAGGLGLFAYEVAQPWETYTQQLAEATQQSRVGPEAPGLGTGALGLMLAMLGLVPFVAGALRRRDESMDVFAIGEGSEANFKVSGADLPNPAATPLVQRGSAGYTLSFTPSMHGDVSVGGQRLSLRELVASGRAALVDGAYNYTLPDRARARVHHNDVTFNLNLVKRGAVVAGRGKTDWAFWGYFGGTATVATAFYLLMRSTPDDALGLQLEDDAAAARFASYFHQAAVEPEEQQAEVEPTEVADKSAGGEAGKRARGPEGQMGDKTAKATNKAYAIAGPKSAIPKMARIFDADRAARSAGILGMMANQQGHFLASIDGGSFAVGNNDTDAWGNMVGTEIGAAYGTGGLGLVGSGHSGGGTAEGLIGMGTTGLIGHGPGNGGSSMGRGPGGGVVGFGKKKKPAIVARIGKGKVIGAVDKDTIRRIVHSHLMEVRGCYNAGLSRNPTLEGRVMMQFSILGNGKVGSAAVQENTTKDKTVGTCIAKAVKRWKFPRPRNGGTALVSYPFRLSAR